MLDIIDKILDNLGVYYQIDIRHIADGKSIEHTSFYRGSAAGAVHAAFQKRELLNQQHEVDFAVVNIRRV